MEEEGVPDASYQVRLAHLFRMPLLLDLFRKILSFTGISWGTPSANCRTRFLHLYSQGISRVQ